MKRICEKIIYTHDLVDVNLNFHLTNSNDLKEALQKNSDIDDESSIFLDYYRLFFNYVKMYNEYFNLEGFNVKTSDGKKYSVNIYDILKKKVEINRYYISLLLSVFDYVCIQDKLRNINSQDKGTYIEHNHEYNDKKKVK